MLSLGTISKRVERRRNPAASLNGAHLLNADKGDRPTVAMTTSASIDGSGMVRYTLRCLNITIPCDRVLRLIL